MILQPWSIYLGLAIAGIFTGIGITLGAMITELWLKPYIKKIHKKQKRLEKALKKKKVKHDDM